MTEYNIADLIEKLNKGQLSKDEIKIAIHDDVDFNNAVADAVANGEITEMGIEALKTAGVKIIEEVETDVEEMDLFVPEEISPVIPEVEAEVKDIEKEIDVEKTVDGSIVSEEISIDEQESEILTTVKEQPLDVIEKNEKAKNIIHNMINEKFKQVNDFTEDYKQYGIKDTDISNLVAESKEGKVNVKGKAVIYNTLKHIFEQNSGVDPKTIDSKVDNFIKSLKEINANSELVNYVSEAASNQNYEKNMKMIKSAKHKAEKQTQERMAEQIELEKARQEYDRKLKELENKSEEKNMEELEEVLKLEKKITSGKTKLKAMDSEIAKRYKQVEDLEKETELGKIIYDIGKRDILLTSKEISKIPKYLSSLEKEERNLGQYKPKQIAVVLKANGMEEAADAVINPSSKGYDALQTAANQLLIFDKKKKTEKKTHKEALDYLGVWKIFDRSDLDRNYVRAYDPVWNGIKKDMGAKNYNAVKQKLEHIKERVGANYDNLTEKAKLEHDDFLNAVNPFEKKVDKLIESQDLPDLSYGGMAKELYKEILLRRTRNMPTDTVNELKKMADLKAGSISIHYKSGKKGAVEAQKNRLTKIEVRGYSINPETSEILKVYNQIM